MAVLRPQKVANQRATQAVGNGRAAIVVGVTVLLAAMNDFAVDADRWSIMEDFTMWTTVYNLMTGEFQVAYRRKRQNKHREQLVKSD